ncbi:MAG: HD domain-containing protein [Syntrophomonadaceae bacterium]|nr:HD domain-containing protein [Syntrophomonadaceae bacterium]
MHEKLFFVDSLIPIAELGHVNKFPNKFDFKGAKEYLDSIGKDISDFYFKRDNPFAWFCYYRDLTLIDIPAFTRECLETCRIADLIDLEEKRLRDCIGNRDFKLFFYLVDPRIAFHAYQKLFPLIPCNKKYDTFWYVYSRCGLRLDYFPEEYIRRILKYRTAPFEIPGADKNGFIEIYRGHGLKSTPAACEHSWSLDINTAIMYATYFDLEGKVYQAKVRSEDVVAYIKRKNEKEIIVFPSALQQVKQVNLVSLKELRPHLKNRGIIDLYYRYASKLKEEFFFRPKGTHGLKHTKRVLFLTLVLAGKENLDERSTKILGEAALYHDIGRTDDNLDFQHGFKSYQKASEGGLLDFNHKEDQEIVKFIIENHCIDDKIARSNLDKYNLASKNEAWKLFNIFKDADALDRIRINDLDVRQLRTNSAADLLLVARQLFKISQNGDIDV